MRINGHVERRSPTSWLLVIELPRDKGSKKRNRITETVYVETEEEAEDLLADRLYELRHKTYIKREGTTLGEYLNEWLELKKSKLSPLAYRTYSQQINDHIKPEIGNILLQQLEPITIQKYYEIKSRDGGNKRNTSNLKGLSQRTLKLHHTILSTALKQAVKWKKIPYNPAYGVDAPIFQKKEMQILYKKELDSFFRQASNHRDYSIIFAAIMTGMRRGELLGLRWQDIDFNSGMINIRQQLQFSQTEGYFFRSPKSKKSIRTIPMQLPLSKMLRELKKEQSAQREKMFADALLLGDKNADKLYNDHDLVFCHDDGEPLSTDGLSQRFKTFIVNYGKPEMSIHSLRHTFAALSLAAGIRMEKLQRLMGHESIVITIDMYGHIDNDTLNEEMKKLSKYLDFEALNSI